MHRGHKGDIMAKRKKTQILENLIQSEGEVSANIYDLLFVKAEIQSKITDAKHVRNKINDRIQRIKREIDHEENN